MRVEQICKKDRVPLGNQGRKQNKKTLGYFAEPSEHFSDMISVNYNNGAAITKIFTDNQYFVRHCNTPAAKGENGIFVMQIRN